jgi:hypothetical protein
VLLDATPSQLDKAEIESLFRTHAQERAYERYGLVLSLNDLRDIARRCMEDEGIQETQDDGIQRHVLIVGDRVLWVIYKPPNDCTHRYGHIVTITPPNKGLAMRTAQHNTAYKLARIKRVRRSKHVDRRSRRPF